MYEHWQIFREMYGNESMSIMHRGLSTIHRILIQAKPNSNHDWSCDWEDIARMTKYLKCNRCVNTEGVICRPQ